LYPVHHAVSDKSKEDADGLQGHKVADEHKKVDQIDALTTHLELRPEVQMVVVSLVLVEFTICIRHLLLALDLMHLMTLLTILRGSKKTKAGPTKELVIDIMKMLSTSPLVL